MLTTVAAVVCVGTGVLDVVVLDVVVVAVAVLSVQELLSMVLTAWGVVVGG
jgi:hypothetical protein